MMTPHPACDSAVVPCLHGFQAFLQKHSLRPYLLSCLLRPSLWSQKQSSPWDWSPVPTLQLPVTTRSVGFAFLSGVCRATSQIVCVGLTLFRLWAYQLLHSPAVLNASPRSQLIAPHVGISPLLQLPHLLGARLTLLTLLFFSPSFLHPTEFCEALYIPFQWSGTPATLSSCSTWSFASDLLCSWCSHGEGCTPCPPTSLPSCFLPSLGFELTSSCCSASYRSVCKPSREGSTLMLGCILEQRILGCKLYSWWICKYLLPQLYLAVLNLLWKENNLIEFCIIFFSRYWPKEDPRQKRWEKNVFSETQRDYWVYCKLFVLEKVDFRLSYWEYSLFVCLFFITGPVELYLFIYLFFPFIFISWRLITLQYYSGFVIHWHESAMDLHVFPLLIPTPTSLSTWSLWVFPVHQAQALVSCIQPRLVICFTLDNIYFSMLFSRNIPPSPSPTESKSLFCTSVSLFLFCI